MPERLIIGAMSGTSADGVDAALVAIAGRGLDMTARLVRHAHRHYPRQLRQQIHTIREAGQVSLKELCACGRELSLEYASTAKEVLDGAGVKASEIAALAAHGQTLFHEPPNTLQWIDPALLAAEVGCRVVSDFRRADCAAGGQGAPLVPFADYILFRDSRIYRVLLNIGGIANFTVIPPNSEPTQLVAFDTGPGNCISDWLCRTRGPGEMNWDVDGAGASSGRSVKRICERFLQYPYFARSAPKSTDGPEMIEAFAQAIGSEQHEFEDLLASAAFLTARTISLAAGSLVPAESGCELVVSGGGVQNRAIMKYLGAELPDLKLRTTDDFGVPADAKESIAFALLGAATLDGVPGNVPTCTGANRAVVLGSITS